MSDRIGDGTLAYDMGQRPSKPVIVTDSDVGTVADQKPALKEMILENAGNRAFPLDEETPCVEVLYLSLDGGSGKTYTMPATRIAVPQTAVQTDAGGLKPAEYAQYVLLRDLFAEAAREEDDVLRRLIGFCETVGISETVVSAAAATVSDELTAGM